MSQLTQEQVDLIASQLVHILQPQPEKPASIINETNVSQAKQSLGVGVFANIDSAVNAARNAQMQL
ncbi:MAG: hypothetical protein KAT41_02830, partial [Candidatus Marinimicrobia bacterium]|nr:hypothetical protein [Candidatus Neomarinimicrobiota bacterium]